MKNRPTEQYSADMQAKVAQMLRELPPEALLLLVPGARQGGDPGKAALLTELKARVQKP